MDILKLLVSVFVIGEIMKTKRSGLFAFESRLGWDMPGQDAERRGDPLSGKPAVINPRIGARGRA